MTPRLSRRAVLTGLGGSALAAGSAAYTLAPGAVGPGLKALSALEHRVVQALAAVLFTGVHLGIDGLEAGVPDRVDELVAEVLDPLHAAGFRAILRALEWGTLASRGRRFTELDRPTQLEVLSTWTEPEVVPRRIAGESIKAVLGMAYFANPDVQRALGWRVGCRGAA